ncbi:glycosyltransferase family 4 protein [Ferruginibacter sp. HRS2-29]|uniref:glycosyltransferase family 4 protein n=1 Tax=Ferruginibacter sp. HRS2-29 TaxID=2487334 RepID=UPI0020CBEFAA|nr:glycosyltransferase family 4 protein [Ferruginibacter sp. HRS2-29]MCP9751949.1 glycosyltransferase family 1 protein [Ferruginibacter sp. HRS2-29]
MANNILFLTLRTFSATGGIEKVCRILGKALYENSIENHQPFEMSSMYDNSSDAEGNLYFPAENFNGYGVKKLNFIAAMVKKGVKADTVILSHINLLMVGWMIKKISPSTKIILLAHGIEIWDAISNHKRKMLRSCDQVVSVSRYTMNNIIASHGLDKKRCSVLNNCLDPFLAIPSVNKKLPALLQKYGLNKDDRILMTLTRLSSKERYKGYDKVISAIANLKDRLEVKYLIAGSYDEQEKKFLQEIINNLQLQDRVILAGFIQDEELEAHFALSEVYVMPSRKEGFGIVFIEAMYYGLPVIAGNKDGSTDALLDGKLGQLVDPENTEEITRALETVLENPLTYKPDHQLLMNNFGYETYKRKLHRLLQLTNAPVTN